MNTHAEYRRHGYQPPEPPAAPPEAEASELARHRDPSLAAQGSAVNVASKVWSALKCVRLSIPPPVEITVLP